MVGVVIGDLFLRKMYRFKPRWLKAPLSPALYHVHCVPLPHMNMFKFLSLTVAATKPLKRLRFHVKTKIFVRFLDKKRKQLLFASMHCMSPSMSQARMYPSPLFLLNLQQCCPVLMSHGPRVLPNFYRRRVQLVTTGAPAEVDESRT